MHGLGRRVDVDEALGGFSNARLLTYDRDPVTRAPTVEVAHETVISHWPRYRIWVDEVRTDLVAHGRVAAATTTWAAADEDPAYLLTGGPLAAALELQTGGRIELNELETRYLTESEAANRAGREMEAARRREESALRQSARRRLRLGIATAAVAMVVAVLGGLAWIERQRADALAATLERQNLARELAVRAGTNLTSADPDLSLLLAIAAAEESLDAGEEIPPEVVDALHLAVINPRPDLELSGAGYPDTGEQGEVIDLSADGTHLAMVSDTGGAAVIDTGTGETVADLPPGTPEVIGVSFHPDGQHLFTAHTDGVRMWAPVGSTTNDGASTFEVIASVAPEDRTDSVFSTAVAVTESRSVVALGLTEGTIEIWALASRELLAQLDGHQGPVRSLDFEPGGERLVSGGTDQRVLVWEVESGRIDEEPYIDETVVLPINQVAWHPTDEKVAVTAARGDVALFDAETGDKTASFGMGETMNHSIAFFEGDGSGLMVITGGQDGFARAFSSNLGGEAAVTLQGGGAPVVDAEFHSTFQGTRAVMSIVTVGADGTVRLWSDFSRSELPARFSLLHHPRVIPTPDGSRYLFGGYNLYLGMPEELSPFLMLMDAASIDPLGTFTPLRDWDLARRPAIADDGTRVAYLGEDCGIEIVTVGSGDTMSIPNAQSTVGLTFNSDASVLAGGTIDGRVIVWETATGEELATLDGEGIGGPSGNDRCGATSIGHRYSSTRVDQVMFRPGSMELASAGRDGALRVWDTISGTEMNTRAFEYPISSFSYSPDGIEIVVADRAGTISVLDATTLEEVIQLERVSSGPTKQVAYSPDGSLIAGAGPGHLAFVWDRETGRIARRIHGSYLDTHSVGFVNDGTELLVTAGEGILRGYVMDPVRLVEIAKERVGRDMTGEECLEYLRRSCERDG